jgi:hypothetical protein
MASTPTEYRSLQGWGLPLSCSGRHVANRANHGRQLGLAGGMADQPPHFLDCPKVDQHQLAIGIAAHQVGRLDIPMDDLVGVYMAQDLQNIPQQFQNLGLAQRLARDQLLAEIMPGNKLLHQVKILIPARSGPKGGAPGRSG